MSPSHPSAELIIAVQVTLSLEVVIHPKMAIERARVHQQGFIIVGLVPPIQEIAKDKS